MIAAIQNAFEMSEPVCLASKQTNKMIRALSSCLFYGEIHSNMCQSPIGEREATREWTTTKSCFFIIILSSNGTISFFRLHARGGFVFDFLFSFSAYVSKQHQTEFMECRLLK